MTEHLDADALADLDEGLLDRDHMASARAHVAGCPQCRAELAALTGVRERLAAAAEVEPMPAEVVARLDRALADGRHRARQHRGHPQRHPAARAAALLAPGPALAAGSRRGRAGPGRRCRGRLCPARLRQRQRRHQLGRSAAGKADQRAAADGSYPVTASGRHWTKESVTAGVPQLLAGTLSPTLPPGSVSAQDDASGSANAPRELAGVPAARLAGGPALADCVTELAGEPGDAAGRRPGHLRRPARRRGAAAGDRWAGPGGRLGGAAGLRPGEGPVPVLRQRGAALTDTWWGMLSP